MKKSKIYLIISALFIFHMFLHVTHASFARAGQVVGTSIEAPQGIEAQVRYVQERDAVMAVVELDIASQYYAYAPGNAKDVGLPTALVVHNAQGAVQATYLPKGKERKDSFQPDKLVQAYMGKIHLFVDLGKNPPQGTSFTAELTLLLCSEKHCLPVNMPFTLTVPEVAPPLSEADSQAWQAAKALGNTSAGVQAKNIFIRDGKSVQTGIGSLSKGVPLLSFKAGSEKAIKANEAEWSFSPQAFSPVLEVSGLGKALLFGLLAGLILNLMPCVLPVLTLKIQSLLLSEEGEERIRAFRTHNIYFAAGILAQFFILALILGVAGYMWGELFQNVYFVAGMLVVIFALSLSLMGLITLPILDLKTSATASPRQQAFMTGMVATLLATPCSGPLLGGVLSWAFLQPLYLIVLIIMFVGLGMSLPYVFFSLRPQWVRFMPKPGAWMGFLEKIVAFFLLATVIYMFSILPPYAQIPMLSALLVLAFLGWLWGTVGGLAAPRWRRRTLAGLFLAGMLGAVIYGASPPKVDMVTWQNFDVATFKQNLGKKVMLVEFTADWCPNCKFVEKTVLTQENLSAWQKEYALTFVRVDITQDNVQGEKLLHALGGKSIPLTAIFGMGMTAQNPTVIRDIYSKEDLEQALKHTLSNAG